jgi:electron-transferring-flavoprotein dehydrogenase
MEDVARQSMDVDIVCVGFGPAVAGFLTTLSRAMMNEDQTPALESRVMPGMPLQVLCYERADDIGFGVSGVVTKARGIKASFPDLDPAAIPMAAPVAGEKVLYLLDPHGAARKTPGLRALEAGIKVLAKDFAFELPVLPGFLQKHGGLVLSLGQFLSWAGGELMGSGLVQIWPGTPVAAPLIEKDAVTGVRLLDQGVDKKGQPEGAFMPGMDIKAAFTVVGDGPVGPVGAALDAHFGLPAGNHQRDWAVGMKAVVDLPEGHGLPVGTVLHTLGYPEPEIFGFLYVLPGNVASLGLFVPSWFDSPIRTAYRYLQHWMTHPAIWKYLKGGTLRSWGAKSLQESGRRGEPHLAGNGYARIGEGSGSTNVLTGSGVDEAWTTGVQLAEGVIELWKAGRPLNRANLDAAYVARRRQSWVDKESVIAAKSRDGFQHGVIPGFIGMGLAGLTDGTLNWIAEIGRAHDRLPSLEEYCRGRISRAEVERIRHACGVSGAPLHEAVMDRLGWPAIELDGQLLVSHQDALLLGGKVQAPGGFADHVVFVDEKVCAACRTRTCVSVCSGQAITDNPEGGAPLFDREKCVHCGACLWNCSQPRPGDPERTNIEFRAGTGGLHSAEN